MILGKWGARICTLLGEGACTFLIFEKGGKDIFEWVCTTKPNLMRLLSQAYIRHENVALGRRVPEGHVFYALYMLERAISLNLAW